MTIELATPADRSQLFPVWESAVRATHLFLSEADILGLGPLVSGALRDFEPLHVYREEDGQPVAFLGVAEGNIEMLFVHADSRGGGIGKALVSYAVKALGARRVDVNEQNGQGVGFYAHLGFVPVGRSELDSTGRPFPILHMALAG